MAEQFMRMTQVLDWIPVSRSTWLTGVRMGKFPKPIKLTERTSAWRRSEIEKLCDQLSGNENARN